MIQEIFIFFGETAGFGNREPGIGAEDWGLEPVLE
jgi:hypothetical protein